MLDFDAAEDLGGPEVPEVRHGKERQHPIFPKGYQLRCRKNAAKT